MPLGIFLLLIFILYLIDKHNRWRQAVKITIGFMVLCALGFGGLFGWDKYETWQREKQAAQQAAQKRVELEKTCKDWEGKHHIGGQLDQTFIPGSGGKLAEFTLDPPEGCDGQIEADYKATEARWVDVNQAPARKLHQFGNAKIIPDSTLMLGCKSSSLITSVYHGDRVKLLSPENSQPRIQLPDGRIGCLSSEDEVQHD